MREAPSVSDERPVSGQGSTAVAGPAPVVELRGIVKRFPGVVANDGVDFALAHRRGPCPPRRERRREEHAHEHPRRAVPARCRGDPHRRAAGGLPLPAGRDRRRPRDGPPALHAGRVHDRHRERHHRPRAAALPARPGPLRRRDRPPRRGARPERRPAGEGLAAVRRRATAGRDPQGPVSRRPGPDHGRADGGPGAPGDRRPVRDAAVDDRGGAQRRVHQPQAGRGPLDRRPDHRHAPREGHGRRAARRGRHEGPAGHADGRTRGPREPGANADAAGRDRARRRGGRGGRRQGSPRPARRLARGPFGRDRRHRGRRGQRPERAGRGHHGPAAVPRSRPGRGRGHRQPAGPRGDQARRGTRARGPDRRRHRAEPLAGRQPDHEALPGLAHRPRLDDRHGRRPGRLEPAEGQLRHLGSIDRDPGPPALRRQHPAPDPRARDRVRAAADDRRPAHPRPGRRRGRAGPPAAPRAAGGGGGDPPHLGGSRRDPRALGPGRRAVRGADRRDRPTPRTPTSPGSAS